jgi:isopentenyl phosphate kinase
MSRMRPTFLKLGGALLTDKAGHEALRPKVLDRLAREIAEAEIGEGGLVVAHGSGSFAHVAVRDTGFLDRPADRMALARVADAAARLNRSVVAALLEVGLPAVGLPGLYLARGRDGHISTPLASLVADLLAAGLVPVCYGDAVLDTQRGGAVASTEPILAALASALGPRRIVLATDVDGVFETLPSADSKAPPLASLDRRTLAGLRLGGARREATDVTGGMAAKVSLMLEVVERDPAIEVRVISGLRQGAVRAALRGSPEAGGTRIVAGETDSEGTERAKRIEP